LHNQKEKLDGTKGKLNTRGASALSQADKLVGKIGQKESRNNKILALTISICLAIMAWHYDFFGLREVLFWSSSSSTPISVA
jgi:hypothetical protein